MRTMSPAERTLVDIKPLETISDYLARHNGPERLKDLCRMHLFPIADHEWAVKEISRILVAIVRSYYQSIYSEENLRGKIRSNSDRYSLAVVITTFLVFITWLLAAFTLLINVPFLNALLLTLATGTAISQIWTMWRQIKDLDRTDLVHSAAKAHKTQFVMYGLLGITLLIIWIKLAQLEQASLGFVILAATLIVTALTSWVAWEKQYYERVTSPAEVDDQMASALVFLGNIAWTMTQVTEVHDSLMMIFLDLLVRERTGVTIDTLKKAHLERHIFQPQE